MKSVFLKRKPAYEEHWTFAELFDPDPEKVEACACYRSHPDRVLPHNEITLHLLDTRDANEETEENKEYNHFTKTYHSANGFTEEFVYAAFCVLFVEATNHFGEDCKWHNLSLFTGYEYDEDRPTHLYPMMDS